MRPTSSGSLPARRRADLAQYVREHAQATVPELAGNFQVSADTIRRDLDHLARRGVLTRTHGGAVPTGELATADTPLMNRRGTQREAKERIGRAAARLVGDGETVIINGGTTALEAARALVGLRNLTIVTNNLLVPSEVPQEAVRDLYVLGGMCRIQSMVTIGPVGFTGTRGIRADVALIGVGGVSENGYSTSHLGEAQMMQQMIESASRVVILADSSKFGRHAFVHICALQDATALVTNALPQPDLDQALREADVDIIVADS
jgi:DeoR/GlpR family transcriptional regulator of sugar metabolism